MNKIYIVRTLLIGYVIFSIIEAIIVYGSIIENDAKLNNITKINHSDSLSTVIATLGKPDVFFETQADSMYTQIHYKGNQKYFKIQFVNRKVVRIKNAKP